MIANTEQQRTQAAKSSELKIKITLGVVTNLTHQHPFLMGKFKRKQQQKNLGGSHIFSHK
jgi:hypothetical protein